VSLTENVALIFVGNQLHSNVFQGIFDLMLIKVIAGLLLPLLHFCSLLANTVLNRFYLFNDGVVFLLESNHLHNQLALSLILPVICLHQFLIVLFLGNFLFRVDCSGSYFFTEHADLIPSSFDFITVMVDLIAQLRHLTGDIFIFLKLPTIGPDGAFASLKLFFKVGNLLLQHKQSVLILLVDP
jgi:hypothetical protein